MATILSARGADVPRCGGTIFEIRKSPSAGRRSALILPDLATCADCLQDIVNRGDRRYRYPFTNCTNCGPRFSIIRALPYDRPNTSMAGFAMCAECRAEYENPRDRRFHAQPIACPACGPRLQLWDRKGRQLAERDDALMAAADALRQGRILALKGMGGFQLLVDAGRREAVNVLRQRKLREEKPLAIMVSGIDCARSLCHTKDVEEDRLQ
jgi:hydrogenase maturation protein HypF